MAEIKNNFIKSKMNKDLDERLIPNNEYRDALNVAVSRSEGSDVGSLESVLGNIQLVTESNSNEEIIGSLVDESNNLVYYFTTDHLTSSKAPLTAVCKISVFNAGSQQPTTLVSGSFLNFSSLNRMNGISLIEGLLFFSDNRNQPRKIDVDIASTDPVYYVNEDQISVAKFAPYIAPDFIDLRSLAATKPSTMSDASDPPQTEIGALTVSTVNLDVSKYKNGESIPEKKSAAEWTAADTAGQGAWCYYDNTLSNGVVYGKLYNRHAIEDSRGLAPNGFTIMSTQDWSDITDGTAGPATRLKSLDLWAANPGTNTTGFDAIPSGYREHTANTNTFENVLNIARYWTNDGVAADANGQYIELNQANQLTTSVTAAGNDTLNINGYSVRVKNNGTGNGWNGDPDFLRDKFVKFSYRFKFDNNEYSVIAPFSQDVFIPEQEGEFLNSDETEAFVTTVVEFMQNSVNNAVLNITLPSPNIIDDYKIKGIDIIFKESDTQAYKVLESIPVNIAFIASLNNTNIYQYEYQSTLPIKTLPAADTTRVFDKVPVTALAQETSGNRIMYGNFVQGKSGQAGLDYYVSITDKSPQTFVEYPQHSLKQNRNYQVGVVLADKFGRQTDVILSNYDNLLDSNGNAQPGSNVFSDYNSLGFGSSIDSWPGDNLQLNFNNVIPEAANANNIAGYPGAYAVGNYYTVNITTAPIPDKPYFWDYSNQTIAATSSALTMIFSNIVFVDTQDASNTYELYKNEGNGWIKLTKTTDYSISDTTGNDDVTVTFTAAATPVVGVSYKFTLRYTANNYNKYQTGNITSGGIPLFADFATTYQDYYAVGIELRGLYCDYTKIETITPIYTPVRAVSFFTKKEIAFNYLFDNTGITSPTRTEPTLTANKTFGTYNINVDGFYSYKIGVKQQQQDYYNVYLPGIINGYPIQGETKEQGETAFTTLISDNINKIPRNLEDVGPLQNQFQSNVKMFGRVTNVVYVAGNSPYRNTQFDPLSSADSVDLIGTVKDVFPDVGITAATPDDLNTFCFYNYDERPVITKISTQKAIGIAESDYGAPGGTYPYPNSLGLSVYETSPFVSSLELFYETTSTGLISDLNEDVLNESGDINGISITSANFSESIASGSRVTSDFFPLASGVPPTPPAGAVIDTIFNYSSTSPHALNNTNYGAPGPNQRFVLENGATTGSYYIRTSATFYAGFSSEPNYWTEYPGQYLVRIKFTQDDGTIVYQNLTLQLINSAPTIIAAANPIPSGSPSDENIFTLNTSPKGSNGSATSPATGPADGNWATFDASSGKGWSITQVIRTNTSTNASVSYTTAQGIRQVLKITNQGLNSNYWRFQCISQGGFGNTQGYSYEVTFALTDTNSSTTTIVVNYQVGTTTYSSTQVATTYYTEGTGYISNGASNTSMTTSTNLSMSASSTTFPRWIGQIQNWRPTTVYLYARGKTTQGPNIGFSYRIGNVGGADDATTGTVGNRLNANTTNLVNSAAVFVPAATTSSGQLGNLTHIGTLDGFTTSQSLINGGVRPGQVNTAVGNLGNYDFEDAALVNIAVSIAEGGTDSGGSFPSGTRTSIGSNSNPNVTLYWSTIFPNPTESSLVALTTVTQAPDLPFFPYTSQGISDIQESATATGTGPAVGPVG
tara:strand:+ start:2161 stop:7056 length:4896 start_codon:yes stop_codon:yes gene_type:complete